MTRDEPSGLLIVLVEQFQEAANACTTCEETSTDVAGAIFTLVAAQPACNSIDIYSIADLTRSFSPVSERITLSLQELSSSPFLSRIRTMS